MRRLIASVLVTAAVLVSVGAHAVPVDPHPVASTTFNGAVHAIVYWNDIIYVGGEFTRATSNGFGFARERLAAVDARTGDLLDWTPSADGTVVDLAVDRSGLYLVGDFQTVNGQPRDSMAKLNLLTGRVMAAFDHRVHGHPRKVAVGHGRAYVGGTITSVDGFIRTGVAAFDAATGALDDTWAPVLSGPVYSLLVTDDRVYLGGTFDDVDGAPKTQKLAAVHPATGRVDPAFESRVRAFVNSLQIDGGTLYAGINGEGGRAEAMDLAGNPKWRVTLDGDVQAVAVLDGVVYLGGHFDNVCKSDLLGTTPGLAGSQCVDGSDVRIKLAALDGDGVLQPWTADAAGTIGVRALVASAELGQLAAGGYFRHVGGAAQRRFALFTLPL